LARPGGHADVLESADCQCQSALSAVAACDTTSRLDFMVEIKFRCGRQNQKRIGVGMIFMFIQTTI
jgi:hypothetical protein